MATKKSAVSKGKKRASRSRPKALIAKRKGPAPHAPTDQTRQTVEAMAGYGIRQEEIARVVGLKDPKALRKHYRHELDGGSTKANARVGEALFRQAAGGPAIFDGQGRKVREEQKPIPAVGIFWAKARMGWKEPPSVIRHGGEKGGAPIPVRLSSLTDVQLADLIERLSANQD